MRVYTREGDLIGQFGEQKRSPLVFEDIPDQFVKALLAAEDDSFFEHRGIDVMGLARAVSELVLTGQKGSGGSTLTMQVARNYFLSLERTFMRKFNEILLAIEIERALDKEEILNSISTGSSLGTARMGLKPPRKFTTARAWTNSAWPSTPCSRAFPRLPHETIPSVVQKPEKIGATGLPGAC